MSSVLEWTPEAAPQLPGGGGRRIAQTAYGGDHALVLLDTGEVFAYGSNRHSQLGLDAGCERASAAAPARVCALSGMRVVAVACGFSYSVALLDTGELYAWGQVSTERSSSGSWSTDHVHLPARVCSLDGKRVRAVFCGLDNSSCYVVLGKPSLPPSLSQRSRVLSHVPFCCRRLGRVRVGGTLDAHAGVGLGDRVTHHKA